MNKILFVDIDETILNVNSHIELIKLLIKNNKSYLFKIFLTKFFFLLDYISLINLKKLHLRLIKGQSKVEIEKYCKEIINSPNIFNDKILDIIQIYKDNNFKIILLSETISEIGELICNKYNFEDQYCSKFEYKNEIFTGNYKKIHNKLDTVRLFNGSIMYLITDNIKDLNLHTFLKKILFIKNFNNKKFLEKNINKYKDLEIIY
jgi:phosphoserine phosphatase